MNHETDTAIRHGTGNLFADLGYADPDTNLLKARLVNHLLEITRERKLTQTQAAELVGMSQPDISRLMKGQFRDVSVERIMRMLTRLAISS
jgi:predicted XRE-type DNA-binding protein